MLNIEIEETFKSSLESHLNRAIEYFQSKDDIKLLPGIANRNDDWLKKESNDYKPHNVYAYYIKVNGFWELSYLGQTDSKYAKQRMSQHLIKASKTTTSKLAEFKEKEELGFKSIVVEPQELRHYFETLLIQKLRQNNKHLSNKLLK
jgi:predicted nuclease of restriction endonuclease-like RecB superfamily